MIKAASAKERWDIIILKLYHKKTPETFIPRVLILFSACL
jgi:hypothetical protein